MTIFSLPIDFWVWTLGLVPLMLFAVVRTFIHFKSRRWDVALTMLGLAYGFLAVWFTFMSVMTWVEDNERATHRYNCVMYELALQRNADPDLPDVDIDPAWHELECYTDP